MQAIQTINTNVAAVDNGQRVIVDVVNRIVVVASRLRGYLALVCRCAQLASLERLERAFLAALHAGFAMWHEMVGPMSPVAAGKPTAGCLGIATTAKCGSLSRSLGSLAG